MPRGAPKNGDLMSAKRKRKKKQSPIYILVCLVAFLVFGWYYFTQNPAKEDWNTEGSLVMQVIDVGQGDSILLGCDGEYMLIDCGEEEYASTVLSHIGDRELKYIVATHPHSDHIGAMAQVLEKTKAETFLMPEKEHTSKTFTNMLTALEKNGAEAKYIYAGDRFRLGSADITVVWPREGFKSSDLNLWSAVLLVEYQDVKILLTGDSETAIEDDFLPALSGKVDILKLGHHGSDTSTGDELLRKIRPDYGVISVGTGNDYGHPSQSVLNRLDTYTDKVYRADLNGDVTFTVKEGVISVATEK